MTNWKYTDATNTVVFRILDNGGTESCFVTTPEYLEWLAEGNTPESAEE